MQTALKLAIEPVFEAQFRPGSYGFRPGRSCTEALREVDRLLKAGYSFVVDADLKSYFDTIPHDRLMSRVADAISDGRILALIEGLPAAGHHEGHGAMAPDHGHAPRGGHHSLNAKGNFRFERIVVDWRSGFVLDLRRKE